MTSERRQTQTHTLCDSKPYEGQKKQNKQIKSNLFTLEKMVSTFFQDFCYGLLSVLRKEELKLIFEIGIYVGTWRGSINLLHKTWMQKRLFYYSKLCAT